MEQVITQNKPQIIFAKIVSIPTSGNWSQVYNAGNLFAVLSLTEEQNLEDLNLIGKEVFASLEQEFFTLEKKDFTSIKQAVELTLGKIPKTVTVSMAIASIQLEDRAILYIYATGEAKVIMKRKNQVGPILTSQDMLLGSSGFLQDQDIVVLETKKFSEIVTSETLSSSLHQNIPTEIAENISPIVHGKEKGDASAIIISHINPLSETPSRQVDVEPPITQTNESEHIKSPFLFLNKYIDLAKERIPLFKKNKSTVYLTMNHNKKILLTVAITIAAVLILSIFFAVKKEQDKKSSLALQDILQREMQKYDQGESLLSLNKNLARDDFTDAQKILIDGKTKFTKGSKEEKQIDDELKKVQLALSEASAVNTVTPKEIPISVSKFLEIVTKNSSVNSFTQDSKNVYFANNKGIYSIDKNTNQTKTIIDNKSLWEDIGSFGIYGTNYYVLDKNKGEIYKFVGNDASTKSEYLANGSYDFKSVSALTIDGAIYVLSTEGKVAKFVKGKEEKFDLTGLEKPLNNPLRIFTRDDVNNLYILDNGNSRIVVFNKEGVYQTQYQADILKTSRDFEVLESDKKIYVLSGNKVYQIDIK